MKGYSVEMPVFHKENTQIICETAISSVLVIFPKRTNLTGNAMK